MRKNKFIFIYLFTDARVRNKNIDLNLFYSYVIFTNAELEVSVVEYSLAPESGIS
jgi:hypothetical protein